MGTWTRTSSFLKHDRRGGLDERVVPEQKIVDPTFIARMSWRTTSRLAVSGKQLADTIRLAEGYAIFCDNSFFDDDRSNVVVKALLEEPGRLHLTPQVLTELTPWLERRPAHPLSRALSEGSDALVFPKEPAKGASGRQVFDYFTELLSLRRKVLLLVRERMSVERGVSVEALDESEVLDRLQRDFGGRGRMLATKPAGPHRTDEILVYLAVAHALRTGTNTIILANDADVEEQFFKLIWLLNEHYRAMLCAEEYAKDFGAFKTIPVPPRAANHPESPIEPANSVLVDGTKWGPNLDGVLPPSMQFVPISCINGGRRITQMTFGGEREMADVLDVKDRTGGRSTDALGSRNLHAGVPAPF